MNSSDLRRACADQLSEAAAHVPQFTAFVGLDGFVDEIIHVVDKRFGADSFSRLPTISALSERIAGAAGHSTNIELVTQLTKLGGNGPIMANALATFGVRTTYVGNLGYPDVHAVFKPLAEKAEVYSIAQPCYTDALEFDDGKLMLTKSDQLGEITWTNLQKRVGREKFSDKFGAANLVGFVNWTQVPHMSEIWESLLDELCPALHGARRFIFFDLADPEKRSAGDISRALRLISRFQEHFRVILGLNEKEAYEIGEVFGLPANDHSPEGLTRLGQEILARVPVETIAIHPVSYALAISKEHADSVQGPFVPKPKITTGAGDHFNAGFCLGKLLGFDNALSLLTGVATSGYYVRTAQTPSVLNLADLLRNWPS